MSTELQNREASKRELEHAFVNTNFVVDSPTLRFTIRIGRRSEALDAVLRETTAETWAFVTAYNPFARQLPPEVNIARQNEMIEELRSAGYDLYPGYGSSTTGEWPPEPSVLILAIERDTAIALGRRYGQLAIVFGRVGQAPELIWCF
ncbi:MAG: DUF3293 domain-containing protein [Pyrinomonadaceae bacterium]